MLAVERELSYAVHHENSMASFIRLYDVDACSSAVARLSDSGHTATARRKAELVRTRASRAGRKTRPRRHLVIDAAEVQRRSEP